MTLPMGSTLQNKEVSEFLGIPPSALPRLTAYTIGQPSEPAKKRGGRGKYSFKDAVLIKLGSTLLDLNILSHRVRDCLQQVSAWWDLYEAHYHTGDTQSEEFRRLRDKMLLGALVEGAFKVNLVDTDELVMAITEHGATPHLVINLYALINEELFRLVAQVKGKSTEEIKGRTRR